MRLNRKMSLVTLGLYNFIRVFWLAIKNYCDKKVFFHYWLRNFWNLIG